MARGLALVLSGGGARGAYQVGVLRALAREFPEVIPDILTGVSAGGINAAFLAARQGPYPEKVEQLAQMWSDLRIDDVFRVDVRDLVSRTLRWGGRLVTGGKSPIPSKSFVDTVPLHKMLERVLEAEDGTLTGISKSLKEGWLRAIALTASSYTTGQSITWLQARADCSIPMWERPQRTQPDLRPARRSRDGLRRAAVLLPRHRGGRRVVRRRRHPPDHAALARDPPRRHAPARGDDAVCALARGGAAPGDLRLSAPGAGRRRAVQRDFPRSVRRRCLAAAADQPAARGPSGEHARRPAADRPAGASPVGRSRTARQRVRGRSARRRSAS